MIDIDFIKKVNDNILNESADYLSKDFNTNYFNMFSKALDNSLDIKKLYKTEIKYKSDSEFYKELEKVLQRNKSSACIDFLTQLLDEVFISVKIENPRLYEACIGKVRRFND